MLAAIVALVVQVVWHLVRAVLEQSGAAEHSGYVAALAFSVMAATDLVIVAALANLVRRLTGVRQLGAGCALVAYIVIAASTIGYEGLAYRLSEHPGVQSWIFFMRDYGWYALDAMAIVGFTLAAGRRAWWLAPIAVGAAILGGRPSFQPASMQLVSVVFVAIKVGLLVVLALEAERHATVPTESKARATRGLRWIELITWFCVALTIVEVVGELKSSMYVALPLGIVMMIVDGTLAFAAWSIAQARIPNLSRWLWYLSAICNACGAARLARSWFLTVTRYWGHFDEVPLGAPHWSQTVPTVLASLAALTAFVVYARRTKTPRLAPASLVAIGLLVLGFALYIVHVDFVVRSACYLLLGIATARICRTARTAVEGELPRARVVG